LRFGAGDALRVRFTVSPLWETHAALRVVYGEHRRPLYDPWIARRKRAADGADLSLLLAAQPPVGYAPDFLSPPPTVSVTSFDKELDRVRRTPLARVRRELARCRDQPSNPLAELLDPLVADPRLARDRFTTVLRTAWSVLVEPDWPRVRRILDDDIAYRGERLTRDGLSGLFADLHPTLAWQDSELVATQTTDADRDLAGAGLLLVPSAFNWPHVSVIVDPSYQPTLVYPARAAARLWTDSAAPPDRLARLLGRTRAALLVALDQPSTTTSLSGDRGLGLGTVSAHLTALYDAGLASRRRTGHQIRYWRSPLGQALVDATID
jgi:DNA-binding transcriptional ArsR family regulator